jgi:endoglucanase
VITTLKVVRRLRNFGDERGIAYQLEVLPSGGRDIARLQNAAGATPVAAISIPTRYLHTVTESAHVEDIAAAIDLPMAFLQTVTG